MRLVRRLAWLPAILAWYGCGLVGFPGGPPEPVAVTAEDGGSGTQADRAPDPTADAAAASGLAEAVRAGRTPTDAEIEAVPDAVPIPEPRSRYGNPPEYEVDGVTYRVMEGSEGYEEEGMASWYGEQFHGRRTSSGEPYDMYAMTAAHRSLPLPTYVEVTNLENGRTVVVRVNDRGPFHQDRIIDVSYVAARKLGLVGPGTAPVRVRALEAKGRQ